MGTRKVLMKIKLHIIMIPASQKNVNSCINSYAILYILIKHRTFCQGQVN